MKESRCAGDTGARSVKHTISCGLLPKFGVRTERKGNYGGGRWEDLGRALQTLDIK